MESQACGGGSQRVPVGRAEACHHGPLCCELREVLPSFLYTLLGIHVFCSQLPFQLPQPPAGQPSLSYLTPPLSHGPRPCLVPCGLDCSVCVLGAGRLWPCLWALQVGSPQCPTVERPGGPTVDHPTWLHSPCTGGLWWGSSRPAARWTYALKGPASP